MKRREAEPYTFAPTHLASFTPDKIGTHVVPAEALIPVEDLKDSVAAHQVECWCHKDFPTECNQSPNVANCEAWIRGKDSAGNEWHIDPLCKVRPEAKA